MLSEGPVEAFGMRKAHRESERKCAEGRLLAASGIGRCATIMAYFTE